MRKSSHDGLWPVAVMVLGLAILFGSLVTAGPEREQGAESWPHGVTLPGDGPTAFQRLQEIHEFALDALPTASPEDKPQVLRVLRAAFICAAFDGTVPLGDPPPPTPPAHFLQHQGAAAKIQAAWDALHCPPDPNHQGQWANWNLCGDNLEHGHEE